MLRAGVGLPALMKLLGHVYPEMTMRYLDVTLTDLQREFQLARSKPRHLVPQPKAHSLLELASTASSMRCPVLNMYWRCSAARSQTAPPAVPRPALQSTHKNHHRSCKLRTPENGQRLAGKARNRKLRKAAHSSAC